VRQLDAKCRAQLAAERDGDNSETERYTESEQAGDTVAEKEMACFFLESIESLAQLTLLPRSLKMISTSRMVPNCWGIEK